MGRKARLKKLRKDESAVHTNPDLAKKLNREYKRIVANVDPTYSVPTFIEYPCQKNPKNMALIPNNVLVLKDENGIHYYMQNGVRVEIISTKTLLQEYKEDMIKHAKTYKDKERAQQQALNKVVNMENVTLGTDEQDK